MSIALLRGIDRLSQMWVDWFVDMTWQVTVLAVFLGLLSTLLRRQSASMLHALWLVVLVRLVTPPSWTFPTGWTWWVGPVSTSTAQSLPVSETVAPPLSLGLLLMLGWAGVSLTLLLRMLGGGLRVRRWVRQAEPLDHLGLWMLLDDCRERLGIQRRVDLRNSESCSTPLVVGMRRPVILLPTSVLDRLTERELEAVLMHELLHLKRWDPLVNVMQGILGSIYFFHPIVWWANARIHQLREDACDERTVAALDGRRKAYGGAILKVTEILGYAAPPLTLGILESKHPAQKRLRRILDPQLPIHPTDGWKTLAAMLVVAAVFLPTGIRSVSADLPEPGIADIADRLKSPPHRTHQPSDLQPQVESRSRTSGDFHEPGRHDATVPRQDDPVDRPTWPYSKVAF